MLFVALVMNPLIVYWKIRRNPYPLTLLCQREDRYTHALGDPAEIEAILAARQQEGGARSGGNVSEDRIEALEARIAALEARLAELEG